jgi:protein O-mannosyl-transferase
MSIQGKGVVAGLILIVITTAVYAVSIGNGFVWDDHEIIVNNPSNKDLSTIAALFTSADVVVSSDRSPYYRPLNRLTYLVDYQLFDLRPAGYHAESVLIHVAAVLALFSLTLALFNELFPAFVASLFFAVHPINAEAVNFISGRNNLLATLFVLLSFIVYKRGEHDKKKALQYAAALLFFCGLLCKETALMLLPFLFLHDMKPVRSFPQKVAEKAAALSPFLVLTGIYFVLRTNALSGAIGGGIDFAGLGQRLLKDLYIVPRYAYNILVPLRLSTSYDVPASLSAADWPLAAAWIALIGAAVFLLKTGRSLTRFGLLWCAVNFIPIANIVTIPSAPMADRYMYLPAIGLWLVAADQVWALYGRFRRITMCLSLVIIPLLAAATLVRNLDWRDDLSLFSSAVKADPNYSGARYNLGVALLERGKTDAAEKEFQLATQSLSNRSNALYQLGYIQVIRGNYPKGEQYFRSAVQADPGNAEAQFNLALLFEKLGRPREALPHYEMFLRKVPAGSEPLIPKVEAKVEALRKLKPERP